MAASDTGKKKPLLAVLYAVIGIIILFSVGSFIFVKTQYDQYFSRVEAPKYTGYLTYQDLPQVSRSQVQFPSGENTLTGYVYGDGDAKGLVVIAHGQGFGADRYMAQTLYFVEHGWRVLAYDCTGTHESEGKNTVGLAQSLLDLEAALRYVQGDPALSALPLVLFGHSWGGYAVTAVLNDDFPVRAVASVAGYNAPDALLDEQLRAMAGPLAFLEMPFGRVYQRLLFGGTAGVTAVDGLNRGDTPAMIVHGTNDESIAYSGASIIAHQGEIINPNVVFKTITAEGRNGHNTVFESEAAAAYIQEVNQTYQEIFDRYEGNIPDEAKAAFYAKIDRFRTSELDAQLMDAINQLYENAVVQ